MTSLTSTLQEQRVQSRMIACLLDVLPSRGPDAYDDLCEALLESDHSHVADKLKQEEGMELIHQPRSQEIMLLIVCIYLPETVHYCHDLWCPVLDHFLINYTCVYGNIMVSNICSF